MRRGRRCRPGAPGVGFQQPLRLSGMRHDRGPHLPRHRGFNSLCGSVECDADVSKPTPAPVGFNSLCGSVECDRRVLRRPTRDIGFQQPLRLSGMRQGRRQEFVSRTSFNSLCGSVECDLTPPSSWPRPSRRFNSLCGSVECDGVRDVEKLRAEGFQQPLRLSGMRPGAVRLGAMEGDRFNSLCGSVECDGERPCDLDRVPGGFNSLCGSVECDKLASLVAAALMEFQQPLRLSGMRQSNATFTHFRSTVSTAFAAQWNATPRIRW